MFNRIIDLSSPLRMAQHIETTLGLEAGRTCTISIEKGYNYKHPKCVNIHVNFDAGDIPARRLRSLKRVVKLEVPDWAIGYANPQLHGDTEFVTFDGTKVHVFFNIGGAFKCEQVGEEEVPPRQADVEIAAELVQMTPEQALEYVQAEAKRKLEPRTKPRYRCTPTTPKENL